MSTSAISSGFEFPHSCRQFDQDLVTISFREKKIGDAVRLSGRKENAAFKGEGENKDGNTVNWALVRTGNLDPKEDKKKEDKKKLEEKKKEEMKR